MWQNFFWKTWFKIDIPRSKQQNLIKLTYTSETKNNTVCVCVCVCVFILFHLLVSSGCTTSVTYVWEVWINDLLLWVFLSAAAKFLYLYLWIYLIPPPKTKTPANRLLEKNRYDIMFGIRREDDIYWYRK